MSIAEIMEKANLNDKPVKAALNQLEELGVLTRIGPNNRRKICPGQFWTKSNSLIAHVIELSV